MRPEEAARGKLDYVQVGRAEEGGDKAHVGACGSAGVRARANGPARWPWVGFGKQCRSSSAAPVGNTRLPDIGPLHVSVTKVLMNACEHLSPAVQVADWGDGNRSKLGELKMVSHVTTYEGSAAAAAAAAALAGATAGQGAADPAGGGGAGAAAGAGVDTRPFHTQLAHQLQMAEVCLCTAQLGAAVYMLIWTDRMVEAYRSARPLAGAPSPPMYPARFLPAGARRAGGCGPAAAACVSVELARRPLPAVPVRPGGGACGCVEAGTGRREARVWLCA